MKNMNRESIPVELRNLSDKLNQLLQQLELNLSTDMKLIVWDILYLDLIHIQFEQTKIKDLALLVEHLDSKQCRIFLSNFLLICACNSLGFKLEQVDLKSLGLEKLNIYIIERFMERIMATLQDKSPVLTLDMGLAILEFKDVLEELVNKALVGLPKWARMDMKFSS